MRGTRFGDGIARPDDPETLADTAFRVKHSGVSVTLTITPAEAYTDTIQRELMPRRGDGGQVPGTLGQTGDADRRAGEEATNSIMALQMAVAPAPAAVTNSTASAPWLAKPQLKPA